MIIIMYDTYPESQTERNVTAGTLIHWFYQTEFRQQAGLVDYSSLQPWPRRSRSTKPIHRRSVTRHRYRQSWLINIQTATDREKNDSSADRQRRSIYRFLAVNKSQTTSNNRSICFNSAHHRMSWNIIIEGSRELWLHMRQRKDQLMSILHALEAKTKSNALSHDYLKTISDNHWYNYKSITNELAAIVRRILIFHSCFDGTVVINFRSVVTSWSDNDDGWDWWRSFQQ